MDSQQPWALPQTINSDQLPLYGEEYMPIVVYPYNTYAPAFSMQVHRVRRTLITPLSDPYFTMLTTL